MRPAVALLIAACLVACSGEPERRPNVLWISIDTLRADRLSCYGNEHATSPAIDRLADQGVLFESAFSTTSWTLPSHLSMFTGLPVSVHGVCHHEYAYESPARGVQLPELLAEAGWRTGGFYTHSYLGLPFVFGPGFETYERTGEVYQKSRTLRAQWEAAVAAGNKREARRLVREHAAIFDRGAPEAQPTVDRAVEWLGESGDQPFFLFVHVFDVHSPYRPPSPFDTRFDPDYEGQLTKVDVDAPNSPVFPGMDPEEFEHVLALYDGEIAWVDTQVERLLNSLDQLGLADDTLVVLTSDHGEEFLEHGSTGHRKTLYFESLHVPVVLRMPGRFEGGVRVPHAVSITDLAPTVLAACGQPTPAAMVGLDLATLIDGPAPERTLVSELVRVEDGRPTSWEVALIRDAELVVVHQAGSEAVRAERFDLAADPRGAAPPEPLAMDSDAGLALAAELEQLRVRFTETRAALEPSTAQGLPQLDDLQEATLDALGYTGFDGGDEAGDEGRLCMDGCVWRR